ncbi:hypothetical protein Zmor_005315 [Zophobas morio]|uniref:Uncharacterized protein n=1 Tax=Zophobas morio TaxID=2755281 RepID=A0AA38ISP5_9CUCU|nr:hypothetical protein Zmor_005315 [Zophobas morio]
MFSIPKSAAVNGSERGWRTGINMPRYAINQGVILNSSDAYSSDAQTECYSTGNSRYVLRLFKHLDDAKTAFCSLGISKDPRTDLLRLYGATVSTLNNLSTKADNIFNRTVPFMKNGTTKFARLSLRKSGGGLVVFRKKKVIVAWSQIRSTKRMKLRFDTRSKRSDGTVSRFFPRSRAHLHVSYGVKFGFAASLPDLRLIEYEWV